MKKKYSQEDVLRLVAEGVTAREQFDQHCPALRPKLDNAAKKLGAALREVQAIFPDASFYTTGGSGLSLLLCVYTGDNGVDGNDLIAVTLSHHVEVDGGDF